MKLFALIGLGVCVYYVIEVVSKWGNRNAFRKRNLVCIPCDLHWVVFVYFFYELNLRGCWCGRLLWARG